MRKIICRQSISLSDISMGKSNFGRNESIETAGDIGIVDPHQMQMSFYRRHFWETREEVAKELKLDVKDLQVRAKARVLVRQNIYEPDVRASKKEKANTLEYDGELEFAVVDGEVVYLNPDKTPSKYTFTGFHERIQNDTQEAVRHSYSPESHKQDLLLQSVIVNATSSIEVTKWSDDPRGIRDAYTYIFNPVTNRGKIRIKNMAPDGKFLSVKEAHQRIRTDFSGTQEACAGSHVVFVKSPENINIKRIESHYKSWVEEKITPVKVQTTLSSQATLSRQNFTQEFVKPTDHNTTIVAIRTPHVAEKISRVWPKKPENEQTRESILISIPPRQEDHVFKKPVQARSLKDTKMPISGRFYEKPVSTSEAIRTHYKKMQQAATTLILIVQTRISIGAAPIVIASLTKECPKSIKVIEKSIIRHQKKERKRAKRLTVEPLSIKPKKRIFKEIQFFKVKQSVIFSQERKERQKENKIKEGKNMKIELTNQLKKCNKKEKRVRFKKKERMIVKIVHEFPKRRKKEIGRNRRKVKDKNRILHIIREFSKNRFIIEVTDKRKKHEKKKIIRSFKVWMRRFNEIEKKRLQKPKMFKEVNLLQKNIPVIEKKQLIKEHKKEIKEIVTCFSYACLFWILLKISPNREIKVKNNLSIKIEKSPRDGRQIHQKQTEILTEELMVNEDSQWILLAIIWYLSMIREAGARSVHRSSFIVNSKKKYKKNLIFKNDNWSISPRGVIFAYYP